MKTELDLNIIERNAEIRNDENFEFRSFLKTQDPQRIDLIVHDLYEKVVDWFEKKVTDLGVEDFSQVILKIMEVEKG